MVDEQTANVQAPEATTPVAEEKQTSAQPDAAVAAQAPAEGETAEATKKKKKSKKKQVPRGRAYITATYNNTIVTFTDPHGNALAQSSAGRCGFKGPKKSTPYAAGIIVRDAAEKVRDMGMRDIDVFVRGIGSGRDGAVRALNAQGFNMMSIRDVTPVPHNGCRPKKARRV